MHTESSSDREPPPSHRQSGRLCEVLWCSLLGRGVRRLPPRFRDAVWPSRPSADGRESPSRSRIPTPTDGQEEKGEGAGDEKWTRMGKKNNTHTISNNQISHFHNSTFLNKLSRLSHQTILPRPSLPFFICVLICLCRGPQLRECPVVSRVRKQSCRLCEGWGEVGLHQPHWAQLLLLRVAPRWRQGAALQPRMRESFCDPPPRDSFSKMKWLRDDDSWISEESVNLNI